MKYLINENITVDIFENNALIMLEKDGIVDISKTIFVEEVGFEIIKLLMNNELISIEDITKKISDLYDVDVNDLKSDILIFLKELELAGVVKKYE